MEQGGHRAVQAHERGRLRPAEFLAQFAIDAFGIPLDRVQREDRTIGDRLIGHPRSYQA